MVKTYSFKDFAIILESPQEENCSEENQFHLTFELKKPFGFLPLNILYIKISVCILPLNVIL